MKKKMLKQRSAVQARSLIATLSINIRQALLSLQLKAVSWDEIVEGSGIEREQIRQAAGIMMNSQRTITCWCMTQNKKAVSAIEEIVNLHLMRGQIGKPGAGVMSVRGHSNVQGDRTVGFGSVRVQTSRLAGI